MQQNSYLNFELIKTDLDDLFLIQRPIFRDERGVFIKTYNEDIFSALGMPTCYKESVYSISRKGVLRGMHYQKQPHGHVKLVNVIEGEILDVVVGVGGEINPANVGKFYATILSKENNRSLVIPNGYAHGFLCLSEHAIVSYQTTTGYNPESDAGVRFDSFGFTWPTDNLIISNRDINLPPLNAVIGGLT